MANQRDELMTVEQILAELCGVSDPFQRVERRHATGVL
jgi:hypothetical protein